MRTGLECLVCFVRQALAAARRSTDDEEVQREVVLRAGALLSRVNMEITPPENAVPLYRMISEVTGRKDLFAEIKKKSNIFALSTLDTIQEQIREADDPLRAALHFAVCANIIDYAAQHSFDAERAMEECGRQTFLIDEYPLLHASIKQQPGCKVLYLADNCGEIAFDGLAIRELQRLGCRVTLAVRGGPIINDATREDAVFCGLDTICPIIDNGCDCPGTPLDSCSDVLVDHFRHADIILSKGMGNFETLSEVRAPLFFLFTVKCVRVAEYLADMFDETGISFTGRGEMVFMRQHKQ
jgi:uncharacterized protein with ATP-grasp and redox domains